MDLPSPAQHGWVKQNSGLVSVKCFLPSALSAVLELIKCGCKSGCITLACKCRKRPLPCSDLCGCHHTKRGCENSPELVNKANKISFLCFYVFFNVGCF